MSDSFRQAHGRKVVSRASAGDLGAVTHLLVDAEQRRIAAVIVGRGRNARLVDWAQVSGFGPDAVMVGDGTEAASASPLTSSASRPWRSRSASSWWRATSP